MRLLSADDIRAALPMRQAIETMREALVAIARGSANTPERGMAALEAGMAIVMGATAPGLGTVAKLNSVIPGNRQKGLPTTRGMVVFQDALTGEPLALIDGTALTSWRTAAAAGCATDTLARPDARCALMVGCGTQARDQVQALDSVRRLDEIAVLSRSINSATRFVEETQDQVGATLRAVDADTACVPDRDIVTAATTSSEPVIPGEAIPPGCHVNGVGSFRPGMREFDEALLRRARIFIECRESALAEAGELIAAANSGAVPSSRWTVMGKVLDGTATGRDQADEITFFKSVGHAVYDLYAARAVFDAAIEKNLGTEWTA